MIDAMDDRFNEGRGALTWLLQPFSIQQFFAEHYERAPLHLVRDRADHYDRIFSVDELERVLYGNEVGASSLVLYQDGLPTRRESFVRRNQKKGESARDVIDADRISALFANGCSIVFDSVQDHSDSMSRLLRELQAALKHRVNANVYMTPPGSQGFTAHYDTHDTYVMQIAGSKRWTVYGSPVDLPLDEQPHDKKKHPAGEARMELELRPGDLLYLPRGVMHEARATDEFSLHVTLGFYPILWTDVVREVLAEAGRADVLLRKAALDEGATSKIAAELAQVLHASFTPEQFAAARRRLEQRFVFEHRNGLEGQLQQVVGLSELGPASKIAIRPNMLYALEARDDATILTFSHKTLTLPAGTAGIVLALEADGAPLLGSLLGREPRALDIVRKLITEGFVYQVTGAAGGRAAAQAAG